MTTTPKAAYLLRKGDTVLVSTSLHGWTTEDGLAYKDALQKEFPGVKFIIIDGSVEAVMPADNGPREWCPAHDRIEHRDIRPYRYFVAGGMTLKQAQKVIKNPHASRTYIFTEDNVRRDAGRGHQFDPATCELTVLGKPSAEMVQELAPVFHNSWDAWLLINQAAEGES